MCTIVKNYLPEIFLIEENNTRHWNLIFVLRNDNVTKKWKSKVNKNVKSKMTSEKKYFC